MKSKFLLLAGFLAALPSALAVNNDGKTDIFWRNYSTGDNAAWIMNGVSYSSSSTLTYQADTNWIMVATADFTKDGELDLLWRHAVNGMNVVWSMSGSTFLFAAYVQPLSDTNWMIAATGYFSGANDKSPDLLWRNQATGDNAIWHLDGTTLVSTELIQEVPDLGWTIGGAADFNADGFTDILWRHTTGSIHVWFMQGGALITTAPVSPSQGDATWQIVGVGHFSGINDGTVDLLWRNRSSFDNAIWQLSSSLTNASSHTLPWAAGAWRVGGAGDSKVNTEEDDEQGEDNLPDLWERKWFGNLSLGANDNPDGDSLTNFQEFQAGTDPLVAGGIPALAEALNNLDLVFSTGGTESWTTDSDGYVGDDHAETPSLSGSGQSWMETKVIGPGTLEFSCMVSCNPELGYLRVDRNGSEYDTFSGSQGGSWGSSGRNSVSLSSGTNTIRWTYVQEWHDEEYQNAAFVDYVTVSPGGSSGSPSLGEALDNLSLTWQTAGSYPWFGQTLVTSPSGGGDAAQSGTASPGQESYLYTSVTGPGLLSFYWKLSAINGYHALRFKLDWSEIGAIGGSQETGWQFRSYSIGSGTHTVSWHYTESSDYGQEAEYGYVDLARFGLDSDLDGLPDNWETSHFNGTSENGSGDYDADGLTNLQEYLQGTNPTLAELRVKIASPRWNSLLP